MFTIRQSLLLLILYNPFVQATITTEASLNLARDSENALHIPLGFSIVQVAADLGTVRHLAVRDNGDIYVALKNGGIVALRDSDGDKRADKIIRFGEVGGTGLAIQGQYLYFSSNEVVYRYRLPENSETLVPDSGSLETVVRGFPHQGSHAAKPLAFDNTGHLYVTVGAPSNACQLLPRIPVSPGQHPCPQLVWQGSIWRFSADVPNQRQADGYRYATGIRNAVAIDWQPEDEHLYMAVHGRDQLNSLWPQFYSAEDNAGLPAEEFHRVTDGGDYGWPYTYYDSMRGARMIAPEYGGDGKTPAEAGKYVDPVAALPAHWAPNDLLFYRGDQFPAQYRGGAFIAFHGSWNRAPLPQQGFNVVFIPFELGQATGNWSVFADGFQSLNGQRHRPTGLAEGPSGELYISDSAQGTIWRIDYQGEMG